MKKKVFMIVAAVVVALASTAFVVVPPTNTGNNTELTIKEVKQYVPDVEYDVVPYYDKYKHITFYELEVTNNLDYAIDVRGTVHHYGEPDYETHHFLGTVAAHETKSVHGTIDTKFSIRTFKWERSIYY
jgi:predicted lipoprotein